MKLVATLLAGVFASSAFANDVVVVDGVAHGTGLIRKPVSFETEYLVPQVAELPAAYSSVDEGYVTAIKNQGSCGSCWSFARTKAFEAALILAGKSTLAELNLAEQDALVNDRSAYGCSGGFMDATFEVRQGVTTEALCPYKGSTRYSCRQPKFAKATRWSMIGGRNRAPSIEELKAAIHKYKVLAVTVAAGSGFSPNRDGRITTCNSRSVNHMVTLVGWRTLTDGTTEFLIANSWGTGWGAKGFAWSRQGCNKLASSPGDAALFITME